MGRPRKVVDKPLGRQDIRLERRTLHEQRKQALVGGAMGTDVQMPVQRDVLDRYRSPRAFMDAARQYLDPEQIGPAFANRFIMALEEGELGMLKLMLPYVFGAPDKADEGESKHDAWSAVLEALTTPRNKGGRRKKGVLVQEVDIAGFSDLVDGELSEEEESPWQ